MASREEIWYNRYNEFRDKAFSKLDLYNRRIATLGASARESQRESSIVLITNIVRESNWQEDYYLTFDKTKEFAESVFRSPVNTKDTLLDLNKIIENHHANVLSLKRENKSIEEIAAYNLALAHSSMLWIRGEISARFLAKCLYHMDKLIKSHDQKEIELTESQRRIYLEMKSFLDKYQSDRTPLTGPYIVNGLSQYQLMEALAGEYESPMKVDYLHHFHKAITMGMIDPKKSGRFRKSAVHIPGNLNLLFPASSAVPGLVQEYCKNFSPIPLKDKVNNIFINAAEMSHRFVRIHPYSDGNGRLSRLIMNFVLCDYFVPVYLKADKKGRHRYIQALRRADRGNYKPLATLIAKSMCEVYDTLLDSVGLMQDGTARCPGDS
ncbi:MAG TPA: Fic family protein [Gemmatales bacterium]|nr:Fic family protein [Gemmatales bacterium]